MHWLRVRIKRLMNDPVAQIFVIQNLILIRSNFSAVKGRVGSHQKEILVLVLKISIS
jgi:hypothetical protein